MFFSTQDLGGCWISPAIRHSIIISHFGFVESLPFWMSKKRWKAALAGKALANAPLLRRQSSGERKGGRVWQRCSGPLYRQSESGCWDPLQDALAGSWQGGHRWHGPCFDKKKDIVAPTDFVVSPAELAISRTAARTAWAERHRCGTADAPARKHLLFISGSMGNSAPFYSQGVRQEFFRLHHDAPGGLRGVR